MNKTVPTNVIHALIMLVLPTYRCSAAKVKGSAERDRRPCPLQHLVCQRPSASICPAHDFGILMKVYDGEDDIRCVVGARHVEDAVGETMDECASDRAINDGEKQGASRISEIVSSTR